MINRSWPTTAGSIVCRWVIRHRLKMMVANNPGSFGYNEATHNSTCRRRPASRIYRLMAIAPPLTPAANLSTQPRRLLVQSSQFNRSKLIHQDLTINRGVGGFQLAKPLPRKLTRVSSLFPAVWTSKSTTLTTYGTNVFTFSQFNYNDGQVLCDHSNTVVTQLPPPTQQIQYLPLSLNYVASFQDAFAGSRHFGIGFKCQPLVSSEIHPAKT